MGKQVFGLPTDTIAAILTAPGRAGISVVRVSGPEAILVAASLGVTGLTPRRCVLTAVHHPEDGRLIDRAVVTLFRSPASYTGEDVLEISGHGGALWPRSFFWTPYAPRAHGRPGPESLRGGHS